MAAHAVLDAQEAEAESAREGVAGTLAAVRGALEDAEARVAEAEGGALVRAEEAEAALSVAMAEKRKFQARLMTTELSHERRWAAGIVQRAVRKRSQQQAVLVVLGAAALQRREDEAAYRFAIAAAATQRDDAVAASEAKRKLDLQRAKDEAAKLFGELALSKPEILPQMGTYEDMSATPGGGKRKKGAASIYGKK